MIWPGSCGKRTKISRGAAATLTWPRSPLTSIIMIGTGTAAEDHSSLGQPLLFVFGYLPEDLRNEHVQNLCRSQTLQLETASP